MPNLGVIAVVLYIVIVATLIFVPKRHFDNSLKKGFAVSEKQWQRKDTKVAYYRFLGIIGGFATVVIMLIYKYIILELLLHR
jgi:hypothetical protein